MFCNMYLTLIFFVILDNQQDEKLIYIKYIFGVKILF